MLLSGIPSDQVRSGRLSVRGLAGSLIGVAISASVVFLGAQSRTGQDPNAPASEPAAISGVVVDDKTGTTLSGALLLITVADDRRGEFARRQIADDSGRFVFTDLPADRTITVRTGGFEALNNASDDTGPTAKHVRLRPGEWMRDIRISVPLFCVLEGRVTDEFGEPIAGGWVRLFESAKVLETEAFAFRSVTKTDDRGVFRFSGLPWGNYVIEAAGPEPVNTVRIPDIARQAANEGKSLAKSGVQAYAYTRAVFPAERDVAINLSAGEVRTDLSVGLMLAPVHSVQGRLLGAATSDSLRGFLVKVFPSGLNSRLRLPVAMATTTADGMFRIDGLPGDTYILEVSAATGDIRAGAYDLRERSFSQANSLAATNARHREAPFHQVRVTTQLSEANLPPLWARQLLHVDKDLFDLVIPMHALPSVRGTIRKDLVAGAEIPEHEPNVGLELDPADGAITQGIVSSKSGSDVPESLLLFQGVRPGSYFIRAANGWIVKSVSVGGREMLDAPIVIGDKGDIEDVDLVVTNRGATIAGVAGDQTTAGEVTVLLFPAKSLGWSNYGLWPDRFRTAHAGLRGEFEFVDLPGGDYCLVAFSGRPERLKASQSFFEESRRAGVTVSVGWGERKSINVRVVR